MTQIQTFTLFAKETNKSELIYNDWFHTTINRLNYQITISTYSLMLDFKKDEQQQKAI